jgi:hypothetical protein
LRASNVMLKGDTSLLFAPESGQPNFYLAQVRAGKTISAKKFLFGGQSFKIVNLMNSRSVEFVSFEAYKAMSKVDRWNIERKLYVGLENSPFTEKPGTLGTKAVPSFLCPLCSANFQIYLIDTSVLSVYYSEIAGGLFLGWKGVFTGIKTGTLTGAALETAINEAILGTALGVAGTLGYYNQIIDATNKATDSLGEWQNCLATAKCDPKISDPVPNPLVLNGSPDAAVTASFSLRNIGGISLGYGTMSNDPWLTVTTNASAGLEQNEVKSVGVSARCPTGPTSLPEMTGTITIISTSSWDIGYREVKTETVILKCPSSIKFVPDYVRMKILNGNSRIQPLSVVTTGLGTSGITWGVLGGPWSDPTFTTPKIFKGKTTTTADFVRPNIIGQFTVTATSSVANSPTATAIVEVGYDAAPNYVFGGAEIRDFSNKIYADRPGYCEHYSTWQIRSSNEGEITTTGTGASDTLPLVTINYAGPCDGIKAKWLAVLSAYVEPMYQAWSSHLTPQVAATVQARFAKLFAPSDPAYTPGFNLFHGDKYDAQNRFQVQFRLGLSASWK